MSSIAADNELEIQPSMELLRDRLNNELCANVANYCQFRCVRHILNRWAIDAQFNFKALVDKFRHLLKAFRLTQSMWEFFGIIQVILEHKKFCKVPLLDVETR